MLIIAGVALLSVMAYLCREALRAEFILRQLKASGPYEAVEAMQIANFGRRVLIVATGASGSLCLAWGIAPDAMNENWQFLVSIANYLRR
jgi:hypothetical protein